MTNQWKIIVPFRSGLRKRSTKHIRKIRKSEMQIINHWTHLYQIFSSLSFVFHLDFNHCFFCFLSQKLSVDVKESKHRHHSNDILIIRCRLWRCCLRRSAIDNLFSGSFSPSSLHSQTISVMHSRVSRSLSFFIMF